MNFSYQGQHPPTQLAAMAAKHNFEEEQTWYAESGANTHLTANMGDLQLNQPYLVKGGVDVGNGSSLSISHTRSTH